MCRLHLQTKCTMNLSVLAAFVTYNVFIGAMVYGCVCVYAYQLLLYKLNSIDFSLVHSFGLNRFDIHVENCSSVCRYSYFSQSQNKSESN